MALIILLLALPEESDLFPANPWTEADIALQEEVERLLARPIELNRAKNCWRFPGWTHFLLMLSSVPAIRWVTSPTLTVSALSRA